MAVARTIEDLPVLKERYARLIHLTNSDNAEKIVKTGLDYENQGMVCATARIFSKENEDRIIYFVDDPRFCGSHIRAVVLDVSYEEVRMHLDVCKSPGVVPAEYVVGVVKPE